MGASQSASANDAPPAQDVKTSYYVLLGVERSATDDEIKKAYRRKALELHPDRNYGNEEAATSTFAEVQAAYEILSDPQERAWYDSHESAILRGDDGEGEGGAGAQYQDNVKLTSADDLARMIAKFNNRIDFSDAPSGFFGFLRETFEHLAKEEEIAANWENADSPDYPSFGHKDDEYDDVVKSFYTVWSSFSTAKTFAWRDKYRLSEAPDRRYRRAMEKENQRARQEGKAEFNEAVRSFVAFVRKRDPRYVPTTQSEAERQKALRDAAAAQRARAQAANQAMMQEDAVPDWAKFREPDEVEEDEEEEEEQDIFECVACNKVFKSEKQLEAHEKSKKHQKAIQALKRKMRKDDTHLELDSDIGTSGANTPAVLEDEYDEDAQRHEHDDGEHETEQAMVDEDAEVEDAQDESIASASAPQNPNVSTSDENDSNSGSAFGAEPLSKLSSTTGNKAQGPDEDDSEDSDYASPDVVAARIASTSLDTPPTTIASHDASDLESESTVNGKPKMGKAAQKRAKKAAAAAQVASEQSDAGHKCQNCNAAFPSKTRLFQHIKDHGHAALKPGGSSTGAGKKKIKK